MQYYVNLSSTNNFVRFGRLAESRPQHQQKRQQQLARLKMTSGDDGEDAPAQARSAAVQAPAASSQGSQGDQNSSIGLNSTPICAPTTNGRSRGANGTQDANQQQEELDDQRPFDVIIFAASSSVGRYLVEELALVVEKYYPSEESQPAEGAAAAVAANKLQVSAQFAQQLRRRSVPSSSKSGNSIRWAVAGRSAVRLSETLCQAELTTGIRGLSTSAPVLLADLNHQRSLRNMCDKTRLVINCAGPYSELGAELLIQACLESGTHYVDLAHETTFIESMTRLYGERARSRGVLVLQGCGFQSMSAECGINFMKQVVDGRIEQVKIILSLSDTRASLRLGLGSSGASCATTAGASAAAAATAGIVSRGMWNSLLAEKCQEVSLEERLKRQAREGARNRFSIVDLSEGDHAPNQNHRGRMDERAELQQLLRGEPSTSSNNKNNNSNHHHHTQQVATVTGEGRSTLARRILERKDTQWLVRDIVQFRNRAVSLAWPLQLIQGFQIQKGRGYCWPIDALTSDESQLIRSEMNNYELRRPDLESAQGWRPIRTSSFFSVKSFTHLCLLFLWLFLFQILIKFSPTRYLMRRLPQLASLGQVTSATSGARALLSSAGASSTRQPLDRDALSHIKYCQTFIAYGQPGDGAGDPLEARDSNSARRQVQLLVSRVVGPEPNHVATATFAIQAALTILLERDHLPARGGVLTPGAAFAETNIIYQLRRRNIKFEVLKKA